MKLLTCKSCARAVDAEELSVEELCEACCADERPRGRGAFCPDCGVAITRALDGVLECGCDD